MARLKPSQVEGAFSIATLHSLGSQLLTYIRSNRGAIVNYGKRYTDAQAAMLARATIPAVLTAWSSWSRQAARMALEQQDT
ncbi:hypothetical protein BLJAPNOD_04267 [Ensifer sp. M14]|uniref:hypothetical protein n=1 Tax=Ensifer sp. M14 TaxID=2203782 RepID=UPI000E2B2B9F|nr:hypothetical protein [Ensifer sp. M14]RDL48920.1 hypothetical protein BLJAPNOD_04267 [Ensifer sp. M14]